MTDLIVEGDAKGELTDEARRLLGTYAGRLCEGAVQLEKDGTALGDLLAFIIPTSGIDIVGVAEQEAAQAILHLECAPPTQRAMILEFIAKPVPPTHVRVIILGVAGLTLMRLDVLPMQPGGDA